MGWDQSRPAAMPSGEGGTVGSTGEPRGHAMSLSCMHKRGGRGAHIQEPHTVSSRPLTPNRHSNSPHHNQARTLGPNRSCRAAPVETTDASVRGRRLPLFLPPQSPVLSTQSGTARRRGGDPSPSTLAQLAPRRPLAARIPGSIPRASSQMPASTHPAPNTVCTPTRTASCTASLGSRHTRMAAAWTAVRAAGTGCSSRRSRLSPPTRPPLLSLPVAPPVPAPTLLRRLVAAPTIPALLTAGALPDACPPPCALSPPLRRAPRRAVPARSAVWQRPPPPRAAPSPTALAPP